MRPKKIKEEFKHANHITFALEKFFSVEDKRNEISKTSGSLWYVFGYELIQKPWMTYKELFCNELTVAYHKNGQITEIDIKNDIF